MIDDDIVEVVKLLHAAMEVEDLLENHHAEHDNFVNRVQYYSRRSMVCSALSNTALPVLDPFPLGNAKISPVRLSPLKGWCRSTISPVAGSSLQKLSMFGAELCLAATTNQHSAFYFP